MKLLIFLPVAILFSFEISAEITNISKQGFVSEHSLSIKATPERIYRALTREIHLWWDAEHSHSGDADNFYLEDEPGGCFCEKLADGGVMHMQVVFADKGKRLRLQGGLGPLQEFGLAGSMQFALEATDEHFTRLSYQYAVGGYHPDGLDVFANPVDQVQLGQLQRLKRFVEGGSP